MRLTWNSQSPPCLLGAGTKGVSPPLSDLIFKKYYIHFFYVHWYISYVYACVRRYQIAWKCSYRQLWGTMWMMGIEPGFSGTAASAQNHWTKLLAPTAWLFKMDLWVSACVRACVLPLCHLVAYVESEEYLVLSRGFWRWDSNWLWLLSHLTDLYSKFLNIEIAEVFQVFLI